jgi:hypothetical protein
MILRMLLAMNSNLMIFTRMMKIFQMMLKTSIHCLRKIQISKEIRLWKINRTNLRLRNKMLTSRKNRNIREELGNI